MSVHSGYGDRNTPTAPKGQQPLPHIDDLVAFPQDVDTKQSIKRLVEQADAALRQSELNRDFNRPALAFKDYIKAYIIAAQVIKDHRDFASLGGSLGQAHSALLKRIGQQSDIYEAIKKDIIADNRKTGVLPVNSGGRPREQATAKPTPKPTNNGHSSNEPIGVRVKTKPAINPKPQSLQGNAVPKHARSSSTASVNLDLAARFANLRGPQSSTGQDPRIKTHQMPPQRPAGPREMPSSPQKESGQQSLPTLPKVPDAIYTPTRSNTFGEGSRPPTNPQRPSINRHGSSASVSSISQSQDSSEYLSSSTRSPTISSTSFFMSGGPAPSQPPTKPMEIPTGEAIIPEELFKLMKQKGSILIIDIRTRQDFDEGHIMATSIICIEPDVLRRDDLSSDDISESLILSPGQDQRLFDRRDQFDLVVFYDQDSDKIPQSPRSSDDLVIVSLHRALVHLSYGHELKNAPKILKGGLDAWIDVMGAASLQSSANSSSSNSSLRPSQPEARRHGTFQRRQSKYLARPLRPEEAKAWREALQNEEISAAQSPTLHRSTESFLRRYPPVLSERESMTAPTIEQPPKYGASHKHDLMSDMPSPPARPAPAVPRPSYSSLSHTSNQVDEYEEPNKLREQATGELAKYHTGLNNPHNWCYANSTLQSLLASPDFGSDLANSTWKTRYTAPKKQNEKIENPQIMLKFISNFFHWMRSGKFPVMKAEFLMVSHSLLSTLILLDANIAKCHILFF